MSVNVMLCYVMLCWLTFIFIMCVYVYIILYNQISNNLHTTYINVVKRECY